MAENGAENVAVFEHQTMSANASVVTMIPIAGPLTPTTSGLGKSITVSRNVSSVCNADFRAAAGSVTEANADRSLPAE